MRKGLGIRLVLYSLVALVICLLATTIWADFVTPLVDDTRVRSSRLTFEKRVFAAIATPPAVVLGRHRGGVYTDFAYGLATDRSTSHYNPPPGVAALEFLRIAVPFWVFVITATAETPRLLSRLLRQHRGTPVRAH